MAKADFPRLLTTRSVDILFLFMVFARSRFSVMLGNSNRYWSSPTMTLVLLKKFQSELETQRLLKIACGAGADHQLRNELGSANWIVLAVYIVGRILVG